MIQQQVVSHELGEEPGLKTAESFGGYFNHPATKRLSRFLLVLSIVAALLVIARQVYRILVLNPLGDVKKTVMLNTTEATFVENGPIKPQEILNFLALLVIGLSIPLCGIVGSLNKSQCLIVFFALITFAAGVYSFGQLIFRIALTEYYDTAFLKCARQEPCFKIFAILETAWSILYIYTAYLALKLRAKMEEVEQSILTAEDADVIEDAEVYTPSVNQQAASQAVLSANVNNESTSVPDLESQVLNQNAALSIESLPVAVSVNTSDKNYPLEHTHYNPSL